ncbi:mucin-1-like [Pongo abelii]|uniref:mucin-1-like n=1 Tax=Pongo abelii TaxID=9601 RepID=UPI003006969A
MPHSGHCGPAFAFWQHLQTQNFLKWASPGPALPPGGLCRPRLSSGWPVQGQLLPPGGLCRPKSSSSRPPQAQLRPLGGLSGCKSSSSQPLQAQLLLPPSGVFQPSPAHASRRPSQAPLLTFGGLCRPELDLQSASPGPVSCFAKACTGPASASQWTLHTQLALASLQPPQCKAPASQPLRQAQLPPANGLFRPMGLIPHNGLSRPSFSLPAASPGPEPPQVGLSRPTCSLPASSPGPDLPPGCVSRPDSCLPTTSLDSAPAQLLTGLVGPQLPQAKLPRPSSGLTVASPGSAPAFRRRLQAPNGVRSVGSSRPSLGLPATSAGPSRPEVGLSRPSSGLPASKLFWLSSCPAPTGLCRPRTFSSQALQAHLLPPGGLKRPSPCLAGALWRPSSCVTAASPGLAFAPLHALQALHFLQSASPGPALPPGGLYRPTSSSSRPPRACREAGAGPGLADLTTVWACRGHRAEELGLERPTGGSAGPGAHAKEQTPGRERPP